MRALLQKEMRDLVRTRRIIFLPAAFAVFGILAPALIRLLPTIIKQAGQQMQIESVSRALRQISPDRGEALVLYFFGGLTSQEVSLVTGKSQAAVKMLLSRGLKDLRERTSLVLEMEP